MVVSFKCKYSKYCGACNNLEQEYSEQLLQKTNDIKDIFKEYKVLVKDCEGSYYPMKYRNKVHLAFTELKGKVLIGFFEEGSTKVTDIDKCLHYGDWLDKLIKILREYISRFKIRAYDKNNSGILRYAHARCVDNKIQLTLVVSTDNFAGREWLYHKLTENYTEVSLYLNINKRTDRAVFDNKFKFVKGQKYLQFNMCGVNVSISPNSFLQVNTAIATKMYKEACKHLEITKNTTVIDLYSGIGITSIMFSKMAKDVFAIEEVSSAVENAKYMAKINNVTNINYFIGKCEEKIYNLKLDKLEDVVLFVDPARAGMDIKVIDAIKYLKPRKIVYMSCNPETCYRDIKLILKDNYQLDSITPYNMFPYTKHIELLCVLNKG